MGNANEWESGFLTEAPARSHLERGLNKFLTGSYEGLDGPGPRLLMPPTPEMSARFEALGRERNEAIGRMGVAGLLGAAALDEARFGRLRGPGWEAPLLSRVVSDVVESPSAENLAAAPAFAGVSAIREGEALAGAVGERLFGELARLREKIDAVPGYSGEEREAAFRMLAGPLVAGAGAEAEKGRNLPHALRHNLREGLRGRADEMISPRWSPGTGVAPSQLDIVMEHNARVRERDKANPVIKRYEEDPVWRDGYAPVGDARFVAEAKRREGERLRARAAELDKREAGRHGAVNAAVGIADGISDFARGAVSGVVTQGPRAAAAALDLAGVNAGGKFGRVARDLAEGTRYAVDRFQRWVSDDGDPRPRSLPREIAAGVGSGLGQIVGSGGRTLAVPVMEGAAIEERLAGARKHGVSGRRDVNTLALAGLPGDALDLVVDRALFFVPGRGKWSRRGREALAEGVSETGQGMVNNFLEQRIYNPEKGVMDEAGLNFGVGFGSGGLASLVRHVTAPGVPPSPPPGTADRALVHYGVADDPRAGGIAFVQDGRGRYVARHASRELAEAAADALNALNARRGNP